MNHSKKNLLLTNLWLSDYTGSELNCLNLATALSEMGYNVEVATFESWPPMADEFYKANIPVRKVLNEDLSRKHYDIIWAHHSIVLDHLLFTKGISADVIIASSLSPFEPFEVLPIYFNDISLCLANSEETKKQLLSEGLHEHKVRVFPNYVDKSWLKYKKETPVSLKQNPQKIAIVSNHVPEELLHAKELLTASGYFVDIYGMGYKFVKITPEILADYDVVITIGKTVQFCMALEIPVYCYDIHGGPGYISKNDFSTAAYFNFSGRGFSPKNAQDIAHDVINNYAMQHSKLTSYREYIEENCVLEKNIKTILKIAEANPIDCNSLRLKYHWVSRNNSALVKLFPFRAESFWLNDVVNTLKAENELLRNQLSKVSAELDMLNEQLHNSRLWKLRNIIRNSKI